MYNAFTWNVEGETNIGCSGQDCVIDARGQFQEPEYGYEEQALNEEKDFNRSAINKNRRVSFDDIQVRQNYSIPGNDRVVKDKLNLSAMETGLDQSQRTVPRNAALKQEKSVLHEAPKRPQSSSKANRKG